MTDSSRKYREAITFQKRTLVDSRGGQPLESWAYLTPRRAEVRATGQADQIQHDQKVNTEDYTVTMPLDGALAALQAKDIRLIWRMRAGSVTLNVLTMDTSQTGRGAELVLKCRKDKT